MLPISIIVPCYNAAATLARTLDSCVIQPEAAQIIVVDDGSSDDSIEIVCRYGERDPRVCLLQMPTNGGAARARNWGAMHATQPVLAFIDADDEYFPGALSVASGFLKQIPSAASIRLDVEYAGFPLEIIEHPLFEACCEALSNILPSSLIIRRSVYAAFGGFPMDDFFRHSGGEDAAFAMALSSLFGDRRVIGAKLVRMHYHPRSHAGFSPLAHQFVNKARTDIAQLRTLSAPAGNALP
jgi:glycosyltransferase involved in cell wall biosynthesis